jgi:alpha-ketoglutarate-dependent taurine dioxygenase
MTMKGMGAKASGFEEFRAGRRKAVSLTQAALVKESALDGGSMPLLIEPTFEGVNLAQWGAGHREHIEGLLLRHGALLFRGFRLGGVERFEEFARAVSPELLDYRERSSPRTELSRGVYTSTDHPADQSIHFHNEQSYTHSWPMKLWFYCALPAEGGGATPIADGRKVLSLIDPEVRQRLIEKRVMYVRNYGDGLGLSWQTTFQTNSHAEVEEYCRRASIEFEWKSGDRLRTRQIFDTIVTHPKTGESTWFEHAMFFNIDSLAPDIREAITSEFDEEDLPFNTYYGDGTRLEDSLLAAIRAAYEQSAVRFRWQKDDVLLIDNMLTSHARDPYSGPRKIVVAMAELHSK